MAIVLVRYGALLGAFLILLEVVRRYHIADLLPFDLYIGLAGLMFLALGIAMAFGIASLTRKNRRKDAVAAIADPGEFSARELDVLTFLVHGYSNKEIADRLGITQNTVKSHLKRIYGKLGVNNRTQAAAEAQMTGIVAAL